MEWTRARRRYAFLAEAFDGGGGFAPEVEWLNETLADGSTRRIPARAPACHLVPYPRESAAKFASRAAVAVYENHLRSACERFCGFLSRRRPIRTDATAPLVDLFINNCDLRGTSLDSFFRSFLLQAKARGAMLLLIDEMPAPIEGEQTISLAQQTAQRRIPYLRAIAPEAVHEFETDDATGAFRSITIDAVEVIDGKAEEVNRKWDAAGWAVMRGKTVLRQGLHSFGACPVLAFTESGQPFPHIGKFAQIADLSRRLFNARSELDEILRGQTFSILAFQVPQEQASQFDAAVVGATVGTHSMLVHGGETPSFIAPDSGPADVYLRVIEQLEQSVRRIAMEDSTADAKSLAESGVARRLRFEALNADLAGYASNAQQLEQRMWDLFHHALKSTNRVQVEWPSDFNLVDSLAELDILQAMQTTGFPPLVLAEKRKTIAGAEFDAADDDTKRAVIAAIDEQAQEPAAAATPDVEPEAMP